ncbi:MAG: MutS-related protein [Myxococcaceae bacterium]
MSVEQVYRARLATLSDELKRLDGQSGWYANGRGVSFLAALVFLGARIFHGSPSWGFWAAGVCIAIYAVLAVLHGRVSTKEERAKVLVELNERGVARLTGEWHKFAARGDEYANPAHLYTPDLDVFGQGSLFQLMDETGTKAGEAKLAAWLSEPAVAEEVSARQGAVKELIPLVDFRQAVVTACRLVAKQKLNPAQFIRWAEGGELLASIRWAKALPFVLPPVTLVLLVLGRLGVIPDWAVWIGLAAQVAVVQLTKKPIAEMHERISAGERGFLRCGPAFAAVEVQPFSDSLLQKLVKPIDARGGEKVSARLNAFSRLMSYAEQRRSQFHPVLNALLLWDLIFFFRLEGWRARNGAQVRAWFEALSEMEALISVATFAHDRPSYCWPTVVANGPRFVAKQVGHPLLDAPVRNDVSLEGPRTGLLITGSNMSGKTTLLRAMGSNAILALMGAPVSAEALELSVVHTLTSMRVKDSLERGVSYFYAEVQRLKAVLDAAHLHEGRVLFLLDEILLGTNTKERQIASREVLRLLLATGACGGVSTHDLSLAELEKESAFQLRNVHFRDLVQDGKMTFDYRLREGVVDTTNALRVLELAGIPVKELA